MRHQRRRMSPRRAAVLIVIIAVALIALYQGGRWYELSQQQPETRADHRQRYAYDQLITVDGASYRQRKDLTTILLMGVDRDSSAESTGFRNGGQADFLRLVVVDAKAQRVSQLAIDRDTMTPITILGVLGDKAGVRTAQISLSHGFGDGKVQSCELAVEAVSNLLLGTEIDFYMALNLDGIAQLNDLVGGVTVTVQQDLTAVDPALRPGATVTLRGKQAEAFVRSRMSVGSGTNVERMGRQQQYMEQLGRVLNERIREDQQFAGTLFDGLEPYLTTNLARGRLINEAWLARAYDHAQVFTIPGEHREDEAGFMEFYADETALRETVLELFYEKVE